METQTDSSYGSWRLHATPTLVVTGFVLVFPAVSLVLAVICLACYGVLKTIDPGKAVQLLPGPLVIVDIIVDDVRTAVRQSRQLRQRQQQLARYGPDVEYF